MALSQEHATRKKLFEQTGKITGFKITKVHPLNGIEMELSFVADNTGFNNFPNAKNIGSAITTLYPHGMFDMSLQGYATTPTGDQILWWGHEKSKIVPGGKRKGLGILSLFSNSQKIPWINSTIITYEVDEDLSTQQFTSVGYEWVP